MLVHFMVLAVICGYGLVTYNHKKITPKMNKRFITVSFFTIFLVQALRSRNVGWDTTVYYAYYRYMPRIPIIGYKWEPLFVLLNKIANIISENPQTIFILSSAIINFLIAKFLFDNSRSDSTAFWCVFLYLTLRPYFNSMNLIRQYLAIAVGIQAYTLLKRNQSFKAYLKAFLILAIATCFHRTSIVLVTIPIILSFKKIRIREVLLVPIGVSLFLALFDRIVNLTIVLFKVYRKYLESDFMEGLSVSGYHFIVAAAMTMVLIFYFIQNKKRINKDIFLGHEAMFCIIYIVLKILRVKISFAVRIGYYFELPTLLFLALVPQYTNPKNKKIIYFFLFLLGIISFIYLLLSPYGSRGTSNYSFFWQV